MGWSGGEGVLFFFVLHMLSHVSIQTQKMVTGVLVRIVQCTRLVLFLFNFDFQYSVKDKLKYYQSIIDHEMFNLSAELIVCCL